MPYSYHSSHEWTIDSGAGVCTTPSREMFRGDEPCTDDEFVSSDNKGGLKIKAYGKLLLKVRKRNFTLSLNRVAYVTKLRCDIIYFGALDNACNHFTAGEGLMIMCDMDLKFKKQFRAYVGRDNRVKSRENYF